MSADAKMRWPSKPKLTHCHPLTATHSLTHSLTHRGRRRRRCRCRRCRCRRCRCCQRLNGPTTNVRPAVRPATRSVFGVRCSVFGVRWSVVGGRWSVVGVRCSVFGVRCSVFGVLVFSVRCIVQCSGVLVFSVQWSLCGLPLGVVGVCWCAVVKIEMTLCVFVFYLPQCCLFLVVSGVGLQPAFRTLSLL